MARAVEFSYAELAALPQVITRTLQCAGNGRRFFMETFGITPPASATDSARTPVCRGWARSNDHLGAPAVIVDACNGVLARVHRPQRGAPECGAVHTVLPDAVRSGGSAVPRSRCSAR